jgi:hypothetical protein
VSVQQQGRDWESDFAKEFGLELVPGSGSPWWSGKLDVYGKGARWSLKWTSKESFAVTKKIIEEALQATSGLTGASEIPMWAFNLQGEELIMMRKEDFKQMQAGELNVLPEVRTKTAERNKLAETPILLRHIHVEEDNEELNLRY